MIVYNDPAEYTVNPKEVKKEYHQEENTYDKTKYQFYVIDNIDSIVSLPGKPIENGGMEYSQTKRWNKTLDELENQQLSQEEILTTLKNIEEALHKIHYLISNDMEFIKTSMNNLHSTCVKISQNNYDEQKNISLWKKLIKPRRK